MRSISTCSSPLATRSIRSPIIAWIRGYSDSSAPPRKTPRSVLFFAHSDCASIAEPARAGDADADERAAVGERADAVDEVLAADRVEHDVDAAAVGQLAARARRSCRSRS